MYFLKGEVIEHNNKDLLIEVNGIGYKGILIASKDESVCKTDCDLFYILHYRNDFTDKILFFYNSKTRDLVEILLEIKNVGLKTIENIFDNVKLDDFLAYIKSGDISKLTDLSGISEVNAKNIMYKLREKYFKQKYSQKQMNVINSLHRLGYKISDVYQVVNKVNFSQKEDIILKESLILFGKNINEWV